MKMSHANSMEDYPYNWTECKFFKKMITDPKFQPTVEEEVENMIKLYTRLKQSDSTKTICEFLKSHLVVGLSQQAIAWLKKDNAKYNQLTVESTSYLPHNFSDDLHDPVVDDLDCFVYCLCMPCTSAYDCNQLMILEQAPAHARSMYKQIKIKNTVDDLDYNLWFFNGVNANKYDVLRKRSNQKHMGTNASTVIVSCIDCTMDMFCIPICVSNMIRRTRFRHDNGQYVQTFVDTTSSCLCCRGTMQDFHELDASLAFSATWPNVADLKVLSELLTMARNQYPNSSLHLTTTKEPMTTHYMSSHYRSITPNIQYLP